MIARCALDATAELGYSGATVSEIARRAGCSRRTFWNHFSDVESALLEAALPPDVTDRLFPRAGTDPAALLGAWEASAAAALADGSLTQVQVLRDSLPRGIQRDLVTSRVLTHMIRAAQQALPPGRPGTSTLLASVTGAALAITLMGSPGPPERSDQESLEEAVRACFRGVRDGLVPASAAR